MGPVVDVELVSPPDQTPSGVVFGIKHLLTIPNFQEAREAFEEGTNSHNHYIIKMTKIGKGHKMEIIDSTTSVTSHYFITAKLAQRSLCKITSAWLPWGGSTEKCTHGNLKDIVVTQKVGRCPHKNHSLYIWCICPSSKNQFHREMRECGHADAETRKKVNLQRSHEFFYNIKVRLSEREDWGSPRQISHLEMCQSNGVKRLDGGTLKGDFGCGCDGEDTHCRDFKPIFFEIEEMHKGSRTKIIPDDAILRCQPEENMLGPVADEEKSLVVNYERPWQLARWVSLVVGAIALWGGIIDASTTMALGLVAYFGLVTYGPWTRETGLRAWHHLRHVVDPNREALRRIMIKEIPRPHRPGEFKKRNQINQVYISYLF